jgi:hypothetical protein
MEGNAMSNMRDGRPDGGPWMPLDDATASGVVVWLLEDSLAGNTDPPLHRTTASAVEAVLVGYVEETRPGLLLADGSVVVLGWRQMRALRDAFSTWEKLLTRTQLEVSDPVRASMELAQ